MTTNQVIATLDDLAEFVSAGPADEDSGRRRNALLTALRAAYFLGVRRTLEANLPVKLKAGPRVTLGKSPAGRR